MLVFGPHGCQWSINWHIYSVQYDNNINEDINPLIANKNVLT